MRKGKKESYAQMEPAMKKQVLSNKAIWYKSLDPAEKEKLLSRRARSQRKGRAFVQISRLI